MNVYPSTLPCPQTDALTPAERRQLSDVRRPREARALQRDRLTFERITWPPMPPEKTEVFLDWWRTELVYGGAWFEATWPNPRGKITLVRKFIEQPRWEFVPGGFWRLSAVCEIRGLGSQPGRSDPFFSDVVLLCKFNRAADLGTFNIFDSTVYANHGTIVENPNSTTLGRSSVVTGSIIPSIGSGGKMFLSPYGVSGDNYQVSGRVPAAPQYGISGPFTIELVHDAGTYLTSGTGSFVLFSCFAENGPPQDGYWRLWLDRSDNHVNFKTYLTVGAATAVESSIVMPDVSHIAVTRADDGLLRLFINGQIVDTSLTTSTVTLNTVRILTIGGTRWEEETNVFADGNYDEVRITAACRYLTDFDYLAELPFPSN